MHYVNKRQQYEIFKHSHLMAETLFCGTNIDQNLWVTTRHIWYLPLVWQYSLQWRHNERDGVSNHQPHDCLLDHFIQGADRWPLNSPRKMFPFDGVTMKTKFLRFEILICPLFYISFNFISESHTSTYWIDLSDRLAFFSQSYHEYMVSHYLFVCVIFVKYIICFGCIICTPSKINSLFP